MNPDVQQKLEAEIDENFEDDPVSNSVIIYTRLEVNAHTEASLYEAAQKLKYIP